MTRSATALGGGGVATVCRPPSLNQLLPSFPPFNHDLPLQSPLSKATLAFARSVGSSFSWRSQNGQVLLHFGCWFLPADLWSRISISFKSRSKDVRIYFRFALLCRRRRSKNMVNRRRRLNLVSEVRTRRARWMGLPCHGPPPHLGLTMRGTPLFVLSFKLRPPC